MTKLNLLVIAFFGLLLTACGSTTPAPEQESEPDSFAKWQTKVGEVMDERDIEFQRCSKLHMQHASSITQIVETGKNDREATEALIAHASENEKLLLSMIKIHEANAADLHNVSLWALNDAELEQRAHDALPKDAPDITRKMRQMNIRSFRRMSVSYEGISMAHTSMAKSLGKARKEMLELTVKLRVYLKKL